MVNPVARIREFIRGLGPVEQAQIVASTAVVVTMATILSAMAATGQSPRLMDFISILAVGVIGFTSVYFSLTHSRELDDQRKQLLALNTLAEAVNRVVALDHVLQTALAKITETLDTAYGWIYLFEGKKLVLQSVRGTEIDFLSVIGAHSQSPSYWLNQPHIECESLTDSAGKVHPELKAMGIQFWASMPLRTRDAIIGVLVIGNKANEMLTLEEADLVEVFGNHISVAVSNARLFERLRQSEQQYADLFENAPDIYLSINRHHEIVGCNRHGAEMLGYSKEEVVGQPFESLFVPPQQESLRKLTARMFDEGRALKDVEEQMVAQDGKTVFVLLNSSLVLNQHGEPSYARVVARDITERKNIEGALLHAQKIDSIGNLAGGIAHDFNNILAAILGSASIMRRHVNARAKLSKYVEIIEASARRGSSLTRQLLTFARKTETITAPVDINALVRETLDLYQRSVSKDITVRCYLTDERVTVHGDDGQIQQALLNLFLNARDAMPDGGTLTIATFATVAGTTTPSRFLSVQPGPFVEIRVSDTGRGIPPDTVTRIFEPFFTTKDNGTGLGLSVVYGVVQNHGGFINLESTPGQGTTFSIFLPRSKARASSPALRKRPRLPRGTENVLIIDDEVSVCEIAKDMLSGLGYTIYTAHNGRDGINMYRDRQATIDLILLDINMPVMSGQEAFDQLRHINPGVRIIIVTGYGRGVLETPKFSSAVNGFVQKPFQIETLSFRVRQALDQTALQPETTA